MSDNLAQVFLKNASVMVWGLKVKLFWIPADLACN